MSVLFTIPENELLLPKNTGNAKLNAVKLKPVLAGIPKNASKSAFFESKPDMSTAAVVPKPGTGNSVTVAVVNDPVSRFVRPVPAAATLPWTVNVPPEPNV